MAWARIRRHTLSSLTKKEEGKGVGLGLATVYGIVHRCGGEIWLTTAPGKGASFTILLPHSQKREALPPRSAAADHLLSRPATVLVVEDERAVRDLVVSILRKHSHQVLAADSPEQALQVSEAHEGTIDLLLTDVVMPGMSGPKLSAELCRKRPNLRTLYMSGYTADHLGQEGVLAPEIELLQKPFTPADLLQRVARLLEPAGRAGSASAGAS